MNAQPFERPVWFFTVGLASVWMAFNPTMDETSGILLLLVAAMAGLPHGAMDLVLADRALVGEARHFRALLYYGILYGVFAVAVLFLWSVLPLACTIGFLVISWAHFGGWEGRGTSPADSASWSRMLVEGAIPILLPLLARQGQSWEVIGWLAGRDGTRLAIAFDGMLALAVLLVPSVALVVWLTQQVRGIRAGRQTAAEMSADLLRWLACGLLFAFTPPLLAFTVYFSLWHSPEHFRAVMHDLYRGTDCTLPRRDAALLWGATLLPLALGIAVAALPWMSQEPIIGAARSCFIGLAALTVPHMLHRRLVEIAAGLGGGVPGRSVTVPG